MHPGGTVARSWLSLEPEGYNRCAKAADPFSPKGSPGEPPRLRAPRRGPPEPPPYVRQVLPVGRGGRTPGAHLPAGGPALSGAQRADAPAERRAPGGARAPPGPAALGDLSAPRVPAHTQPRSRTRLTYRRCSRRRVPLAPQLAEASRVQGQRRSPEAGPARNTPRGGGAGAGPRGETGAGGLQTCGPNWESRTSDARSLAAPPTFATRPALPSRQRPLTPPPTSRDTVPRAPSTTPARALPAARPLSAPLRFPLSSGLTPFCYTALSSPFPRSECPPTPAITGCFFSKPQPFQIPQIPRLQEAFPISPRVLHLSPPKPLSPVLALPFRAAFLLPN